MWPAARRAEELAVYGNVTRKRSVDIDQAKIRSLLQLAVQEPVRRALTDPLLPRVLHLAKQLTAHGIRLADVLEQLDGCDHDTLSHAKAVIRGVYAPGCRRDLKCALRRVTGTNALHDGSTPLAIPWITLPLRALAKRRSISAGVFVLPLDDDGPVVLKTYKSRPSDEAERELCMIGVDHPHIAKLHGCMFASNEWCGLCFESLPHDLQGFLDERVQEIWRRRSRARGGFTEERMAFARRYQQLADGGVIDPPTFAAIQAMPPRPWVEALLADCLSERPEEVATLLQRAQAHGAPPSPPAGADTALGVGDPLLWTFAVQVLTALAFLHERHIYHLDVKPGNIAMDAARQHFKVIDFGLSHCDRWRKKEMAQVVYGDQQFDVEDVKHLGRLHQVDQDRRDNYSFGTQGYMPHHTLHNRADFLLRRDQWAFGCTLYEAAYGTLLYRRPEDRFYAMLQARLRPSTAAQRAVRAERGLVPDDDGETPDGFTIESIVRYQPPDRQG